MVRFELSTLDSEPGLVAYMNIFARTNDVVAKYTLKKVVEDWNAPPHVQRGPCQARARSLELEPARSQEPTSQAPARVCQHGSCRASRHPAHPRRRAPLLYLPP